MVLVTGAARGIGKESPGSSPSVAPPCLVSARDADHARAAAEELSAGGEVRALKVGLQVTDDASVRAGAQAL